MSNQVTTFAVPPGMMLVQADDFIASPLQVLGNAIKQGCDANSLTQLSELVKSWKDTIARENFGLAIAAFQRTCPPIVKRNEVRRKDGSVRYKFASFEDVWHVAGPYLTELGISVSFSSPVTTNGMYSCICTLRVGGYSEAFPFSAPMPNLAKIASDSMIAEPAAFGFVLSYYKRYALCAALNIVVVGEDSDMFIDMIQTEGITEEEAKYLQELLTKRGTRWSVFSSWASAREHRPIESVKDLSRDTFIIAKQEALEAIASREQANAAELDRQAKAKGTK